MRLLSLTLCLTLAACAHSPEHWGDDEELPARSDAKKGPAKAATNGPPVSFVVASGEEGEGTGDALDKVKNDLSAPKSESTGQKLASDGVPVVREPKAKTEIPVIIEKPKPESTHLRPEDEAPATSKLPPPPALPKAKPGKPEAEPAAVALETRPSEDPFKKLERDLARTEPAPQKPKAEPTAPAVAAADDYKELDKPKKKKSDRDPKRFGLSVLVSGGVLASQATIPEYGYHLAYGGQVTMNPAFMGAFHIELGFWRSTRSTTSGFSAVDTTSNYAALGISFLPTVVAGLYLGVGVDGIAAFSQIHYKLNTAVPYEAEPGAFGYGGDGKLTVGYRWWHLEGRIDLRTVLRQGYRLEFLPTGSLGATF